MPFRVGLRRVLYDAVVLVDYSFLGTKFAANLGTRLILLLPVQQLIQESLVLVN